MSQPGFQRFVSRALTGLYVFILIVLVFATWLGFRGASFVIGTHERIAHSIQVLREINGIVVAVDDAETDQRAFVIAGDEHFLDSSKDVRKVVKAHADALRSLTSDNKSQQNLIPLLMLRVEDRLNVLDKVIAIRRASGADAARDAFVANRGQELMQGVTEMVTLMRDQERLILDRRFQLADATVRFIQRFSVGTFGFAFVMLVVFYVQVRGTAAERVRLLVQEQAARERAEAAFKAEQGARHAAEESGRLRDEFLATVSHELRSPLNAMLGWVHLLRTGQVEADAMQKGLETIERSARSQAQLVEDLLDVSGIMAGKLRLNVAAVNLEPVVMAAIEVVRPSADAKGVRLTYVLDPNAGQVSGDSERLQQVIWNLLSNAIKFTPRAGRVQVRLERRESQVELVVSDTGAGIAPDFLPHVFELFRQADSSSTRTTTGLGLGLAIVRRITELHGGTIRAESHGAGSGATFTVSLPVRGMQPTPTGLTEMASPVRATLLPPSAPLPRLTGVKVLCVDDQPDTCEMLSTVMRTCGADVRSASSAAEGLQTFLEWRPSILIADIGMPGEDGYSLIRKVRALSADAGGKTPAVALTVYARTQDRVKSLTSGFQIHVAKPVEPVEIANVVASLLGLSSDEGV